jgi:tetratricopeptide (TPR) repeat protein
MARDLGKVRVARQVVDDLLCEPPDASLMARVLLLAASLWRRSGSLEVAVALIRQAESRLSGAVDERARVLHQKAVLLREVGQLEEAESALSEAISIYRSLKDSYGEARALALQSTLLERRGDLARALGCARKIVATAKGKDHRVIAMMGQLELGRLLVASGSLEEGLVALNAGLGQAVMLGDQQAQFVGHRHLWKAFEKLGDPERAALERQAASYFVRFSDEHSPEAEEVRELAKREGASLQAAGSPESA